MMSDDKYLELRSELEYEESELRTYQRMLDEKERFGLYKDTPVSAFNKWIETYQKRVDRTKTALDNLLKAQSGLALDKTNLANEKQEG